MPRAAPVMRTRLPRRPERSVDAMPEPYAPRHARTTTCRRRLRGARTRLPEDLGAACAPRRITQQQPQLLTEPQVWQYCARSQVTKILPRGSRPRLSRANWAWTRPTGPEHSCGVQIAPDRWQDARATQPKATFTEGTRRSHLGCRADARADPRRSRRCRRVVH